MNIHDLQLDATGKIEYVFVDRGYIRFPIRNFHPLELLPEDERYRSVSLKTYINTGQLITIAKLDDHLYIVNVTNRTYEYCGGYNHEKIDYSLRLSCANAESGCNPNSGDET